MGKRPGLPTDVEHGLALDDPDVTRQPFSVDGLVEVTLSLPTSRITTSSPAPPSMDVVAGPADEHVVAGAAEQGVVAVAADEDVVAVAAVGGEQDRRGRQAGGVDHVVAGERVDRQPVVGGLGAGDVRPGRPDR